MGKRQRGSSSTANSKGEDACVDRRRRGKCTRVDRISMLPDELLVSILCLLTLKESVVTSTLSHRWRYVWTFVPKLDFDGTKSLKKVDMADDPKLAIHDERYKYVTWVDHVMGVHKSCLIEDFRVYFNLNKHYERYIDKWVKYALARKVKRLELDLTYTHDVFSPRPSHYCYTFPNIFLRQYEESCSNEVQSHSMRQLNSIHFMYLEKISLTHVNVNGEALQFFLRNCPLLQHLSVSESAELSSLKVIGPFPSLKRLEIVSCLNLNFMEIRDANLVYLKYIGEGVQQFLLQNVPHLIEICTGGTMQMGSVLSMFASVLPKLEKFRLLIGPWLCWQETELLYSSVKMSSLKQLVVAPYFAGSLLPLTMIIRASPCLETFVVEIPRRGTRFRRIQVERMAGEYTHHLKELKFRGYSGWMSDLEFVKHLSENVYALEKIVIDPCKPDDTPCECYWKNSNEIKEMNIRWKRNARARTKRQLVRIIPPRINLQIL